VNVVVYRRFRGEKGMERWGTEKRKCESVMKVGATPNTYL
jgi:hypothetical protein